MYFPTSSHSFVFLSGITYVLGRKEYGRLGLGNDCEDANEPTVIPALQDKKVINISCGSCASFAVTEEGNQVVLGLFQLVLNVHHLAPLSSQERHTAGEWVRIIN